MIILADFFIEDITLGHCLRIQEILSNDLNQSQILIILVLSIISQPRSLESIAEILMNVTVEEFSRIQAIVAVYCNIAREKNSIEIMTMIYHLNGRSFTNWESLLSLKVRDIPELVLLIEKYPPIAVI
jgi:hypothetical protein